MARSQQNWIPLVNYSTKYGVSLSTLRRRIKTNAIPYKLENGKYFLLDEEDSFDGSHTILEALNNDSFQVLAQPTPVTVPAKNHEVGGGVRNSTPTPTTGFQSSQVQESILTTANRLIEELKSAYSKILAQQEEQIGLLKEEIADLRTLAQVLEEQLSGFRTKSNQNLVQSMGFSGDYDDPLRMHDDLERIRERDDSLDTALSEKWNHAIATHPRQDDLFARSLKSRESSKNPAKNGAFSASQASVLGNKDEEFFFDRDENASSKESLPEIDLSGLKIPDGFELDFDF